MGSLAGFVARSSITLQEETSIWLQSQPSYVFLQTEILGAFGLNKLTVLPNWTNRPATRAGEARRQIKLFRQACPQT